MVAHFLPCHSKAEQRRRGARVSDYLWRALSISFFSWWASLIWCVTLARNSSKLDRRCGSSRRSCVQRLRTSPGLERKEGNMDMDTN